MAIDENSETRAAQLKQIDEFRRGTAESTPEPPPAGRYVDWFHAQASYRRPTDLHHQLGTNSWDAAPGDHTHTIEEILDIERSVHITPEGGTTGTQPTFTGDAGDVFSGSYTRIGNLVHFAYMVDFDNITSFGTGQYTMELPYAAEHPYIFRDACLHDASASRQYQLSGHVAEGETTVYLFTTDRAGNRIYDFPFEQGEPVTLATADNFHIAGTYEREPA